MPASLLCNWASLKSDEHKSLLLTNFTFLLQSTPCLVVNDAIPARAMLGDSVRLSWGRPGPVPLDHSHHWDHWGVGPHSYDISVYESLLHPWEMWGVEVVRGGERWWEVTTQSVIYRPVVARISVWAVSAFYWVLSSSVSHVWAGGGSRGALTSHLTAIQSYISLN